MDLLTEFKTYLVTEKGASANTVASYMRDITQYVHYLGEDDRQVLGATSECIEAYRKQLLKMVKSAATVTRALASLKCLYRWLQQKGRCPENPAKGVKAEKVERKLPQILSNQEVELLLEQPRCVDDKGFRDHAMLEVLYATGIRVSELQERVYQGKYKVLYYDSEIYRGESPDLPFCLLLCQCLLFLSHCKQSVKE